MPGVRSCAASSDLPRLTDFSSKHRLSGTRHLRARTARRLFFAALAGLATLPLADPAPAQTITLISNLNQGQDTNQSVGNPNQPHAQFFTTGTNRGGYTLASVALVMEGPQNRSFTTSVCTTSGDNPTADCTELTSPSSFAIGTLTFTAPNDTTLAENTTYALVFTSAVSFSRLDATNSDNEDSGGAAGWSIANEPRFRQRLSPPTWIPSGSSAFRVTIRGTLNSPPADTTLPTLSSATVDGDELVLTYDEALDTNSTPATGAFTVTAGGSTISVSTVTVSGMAVTLGLASAVTSGQTVTISYVAPGSNPIQDVAGNDAAALTNEAVTNRTAGDTTPPTLSSATVDGDELVLTYDEALDTNSTPMASAFTVAGNNLILVRTATVSGMAVTLRLASAVTAGQTVTISYLVPSSNPIQDVAGNDAAALTNEAVTNRTAGDDTTESDDCGSDINTSCTISVNGTATGDLEQNGDTDWFSVTLRAGVQYRIRLTGDFDSADLGGTLGDPLLRVYDSTGQELAENDDEEPGVLNPQIEYTPTSDGKHFLEAAAYNDQDSGTYTLSIFDITSDTASPTLSSATVNGDELVLTYNEALDANSTPATSAFTVTAGGSTISVSTVTVAGMAVTLDLASAVTSGQTVTVDYTAPTSNPIQDSAGNDASSLSGQAVNNETPLPPPPMPDFLVSNLEQTAFTNDQNLGVYDLAQQFTTGPSASTLENIELDLRTFGNATTPPTVRIFSGSATGTEVASLSGPAALDPDTSSKVYTFTPSGTVMLAASTDYWVRLEGANQVRWRFVRSSAEDSGGAAGWSIADDGQRRDHDSTGSFTDFVNVVFQLQINGVIGTPGDTASPTLSSATVNGDELVLTYDEALDANSTPATSAFTVTAGGSTISVSTVTVSGMAVTLDLASAVTSGQTVTVDYTAPTSNPIQDSAGNDAPSLSGQAVNNETPLPPPTDITLISNSGQSDGQGISLTISRHAQAFTTGSNEAGYTLASIAIKYASLGNSSTILANSSVGIWSSQTSTVAGGVEPDSRIATLGDPASLTAGRLSTFTAASAITLTKDTTYFVVLENSGTLVGAIQYTASDDEDAGGATGWTIANGSLVRSRSGWSPVADGECMIIQVMGMVSSASDTTAPTLSSATVDEDELVLTYDEALDTNSTPATSAFTVTVAGSAVAVSTVTVSGMAVTLDLASAVTSGQTVTVSYAVPDSNPIQNEAGIDAAALSNQAVTNTTYVVDYCNL